MAKRIVRRRSTTDTTAEKPASMPEPVAAASDRKTARRRKPAFIEPTDENVRLAAYYRYIERDESSGDALGDWVDAERALKRR